MGIQRGFTQGLGVVAVGAVVAVAGAAPAHAFQALTGRAFFPHLISAPFHDGLTVVFATAAGLSAVAAVASLMRGTTPTTTER